MSLLNIPGGALNVATGYTSGNESYFSSCVNGLTTHGGGSLMSDEEAARYSKRIAAEHAPPPDEHGIVQDWQLQPFVPALIERQQTEQRALLSQQAFQQIAARATPAPALLSAPPISRDPSDPRTYEAWLASGEGLTFEEFSVGTMSLAEAELSHAIVAAPSPPSAVSGSPSVSEGTTEP